MFRKYLVKRSYVQKVLCSEGPIFRRFYVQKVLCSEKMAKRSYIQKVLCSEGPILRYIQKVLYSENSLFYVGTNLHLPVSGKLYKYYNARYQITGSHFSSLGQRQVKGQMSFCHGALSVVCPSINRDWDNQHRPSEQPQTRSDHSSREGYSHRNSGIWTTVDLVIFACSNFREFLILRLFTKFRIREFSFSFLPPVENKLFFWRSTSDNFFFVLLKNFFVICFPYYVRYHLLFFVVNKFFSISTTNFFFLPTFSTNFFFWLLWRQTIFFNLI